MRRAARDEFFSSKQHLVVGVSIEEIDRKKSRASLDEIFAMRFQRGESTLFRNILKKGVDVCGKSVNIHFSAVFPVTVCHFR